MPERGKILARRISCTCAMHQRKLQTAVKRAQQIALICRVTDSGRAMEVILREHVDNLGQRGEIVKVADGYARNYLLPRKLALLVTAGNKKQVERERARFDAKEAEERKVAEAMAARLATVELVIPRRVGDT